jgi:glycosyltransferase involved in cell wall biosynthesis
MADRLIQLHRVAPERVRVVPGGVDTVRFSPAPDRGAVRRRLGLPPSGTLFFTLRNLEPRMGIDRLLRAVPHVARALPDFMLVVGGQGPLLPSLRALAGDLGIGERVRFTGFIPEDQLVSFYQAADGFVIPTVALEGFGLPVLEALACGTPVLGSRVGAIPELLDPLDSSLLFSEVTPEGISSGILALVSRPDLDSLRVACREYVLGRYRWELVLEQLERELVEIVTAGGAR